MRDNSLLLLRCFFLLLFASFFLMSCYTKDNKYDKSTHRLTYEIRTTGIFVELYRTASYGVYGGDIESIYLTDSVSFRKFVDKIDDNQKINFSINGNKIKATKVVSSYWVNDRKIPMKVLSEREYYLDALRSKGKFD